MLRSGEGHPGAPLRGQGGEGRALAALVLEEREGLGGAHRASLGT